MIGVHQQRERVRHVTGDYLDREEGDREEQHEVELDRSQLPEPLFHGHDGARVRMVYIDVRVRTMSRSVSQFLYAASTAPRKRERERED